jgi:hypothetical protein
MGSESMDDAIRYVLAVTAALGGRLIINVLFADNQTAIMVKGVELLCGCGAVKCVVEASSRAAEERRGKGRSDARYRVQERRTRLWRG